MFIVDNVDISPDSSPNLSSSSTSAMRRPSQSFPTGTVVTIAFLSTPDSQLEAVSSVYTSCPFATMALQPPPGEEGRVLSEALNVVKIQTQQMKRFLVWITVFTATQLIDHVLML